MFGYIIANQNHAPAAIQSAVMPATDSEYVQQQQAEYQRFMAMGLSDIRAKTLIAEQLRDQYKPETKAIGYWQAMDTAGGHSQERLNQERRMRNLLVQIFGSSAQQDIAFHQLFQPLASSMGFFSSAQQIVLHEYLIKNRPTAVELLTASDSSKSPSPQPLINIADMLPAADAFEYNLRYSSTANKLRATDFAFTEPQFRQTFKLVYPLSQRIRQNSTSPADQIEQRQQLHKLLGRDGALKVFSVMDSRFTALVTEGKRQGLTQEQLYFVYEIINQSEMQMLKGFQLRQRDHQAGINLIRRASQQRIEKLTSYLGEDIAQSLMKVFAQPGSVTAALSE
jgi:uncharacterized protein YoaH (UPF0181 family)